ncbi:hypothetical protein AURDEDRAFT_53433 [Auricularia subglabra TFB-10046 SS5]|nr:hypothetical protein AURDEDRAFT_53433 [Auricularia subglabra TFB-10046 SS5]
MRGLGTFLSAETVEIVFLSVKTTVWEAGSPEHPKLVQGANRLAFELVFPKTFASINRKTRNEDCELPPSFSTPGFPLYLLYELRCTIHRGMLQDHTVLSIPVKYVPRKEAAPPSTARMLSYEGHTPIPDPSTDPDGWKTYPKDCRVRAFGDRDVDIGCEFSLAYPLEYARGSFIPVHFRITCPDQQALDLLCTPGAFTLHLKRQFRVGDTSALAGLDEAYDPRSKDLVGKGKY